MLSDDGARLAVAEVPDKIPPFNGTAFKTEVDRRTWQRDQKRRWMVESRLSAHKNLGGEHELPEEIARPPLPARAPPSSAVPKRPRTTPHTSVSFLFTKIKFALNHGVTHLSSLSARLKRPPRRPGSGLLGVRKQQKAGAGIDDEAIKGFGLNVTAKATLEKSTGLRAPFVVAARPQTEGGV